MIYLFLKTFTSFAHLTNLFHYISFRFLVATIFSFFFSLLAGSYIIATLKQWQKKGQPIRDDGPESHKSKAGTPTMGGLIALVSTFVSCILFTDLTNPYIYLVLFSTILFGALGFIDDYLKISRQNHHGVRPRFKLITQFLSTVPIVVCVFFISDTSYRDVLTIPFLKKTYFHLGAFYLLFSSLVIVGSSNSVNLTDGLDGLAIVPICIVASCFGLIAYLTGNSLYANYLHMTHIPGTAELAVFCGAIIGSGLGFLWYNAQPAEVFMGDTGSLSFGATLGTLAIICKQELLLAIAGGVFVIETLSVMIQVYYFKYTGGKRFFKMAPLHHHFEKLGWSESKVVIRFWIISLIFAFIALASLKIR
ncbi:MAG: phospho-N-acetylmuramoyl-pentapeptide-transferase [Rickettsiaceae bacterium]|nr:phospho-N-acetylmuramoyl-pentapeptide-transferase [Rickettsiaceae bacterium]